MCVKMYAVSLAYVSAALLTRLAFKRIQTSAALL